MTLLFREFSRMKVVPCRHWLWIRLAVGLFLLLSVDCGHANDTPQLSSAIVGREFKYVVVRGDSLTRVGARFGVDVGTLAAANGLSASAFLREGQELLIDNRHIVPVFLDTGIVINIPQRMLFYFDQRDPIHAFPVALGRPDWPTPIGPFTIVSKRENPEWKVPESIQDEMRREGKTVMTCVSPGPDNPLGAYWFGLSIPGYGIHSTIAPASIYHFRTHGCIRLHPDDMVALFPDVKPRTPGQLLYRRLMVAKVGNQVFLEVHRDIYRKEPYPVRSFVEIIRHQNFASSLDWEKVKEIIEQQKGIAREISRQDPEHRSP